MVLGDEQWSGAICAAGAISAGRVLDSELPPMRQSISAARLCCLLGVSAAPQPHICSVLINGVLDHDVLVGRGVCHGVDAL